MAFTPGSMPRYRLADAVAPSTTADLPAKGQILNTPWIILALGAFAAWTFVYARFYWRSSSLCQIVKNESSCDLSNTPPPAEKGIANFGPTYEQIQIYQYHGPIKGEEIKRKRFLDLVMLMTLGLILWLGFYLISSSSAVLEVFQVYQPVPVAEDGGTVCNEEILLVQNVFGFSYGHPFIGNYEPPKCEFDSVRIHLTVTSQGRQFDRLAHMYLGDIEVFRTSTAEPTANGIAWTYIKDMSQYNTLWKQPQKVIFELGNLINDVYTGSFNVSVTAIFSLRGNVRTPDIILPISAQNSGLDSPSAFSIPSDNATVLQKVDPRAYRAVVSISACGQSTEEFWWSNVFSSDTDTFDNTVGELYGYSPFREVQLYIDGILAGVVWPFPIIFTGGVAPGFWRPIVGTDAFDLRQPEIDISPFLPLLTDDQHHSFEIRVVGMDVSIDGTATLSDTVGSYWVVTGTIFLYLSNDDAELTPSTSPPSLREPEVMAPSPVFTTRRVLDKNAEGHNETLRYYVRALRTLTVKSSKFSWTQNLSFVNMCLLHRQGLSQENDQFTYSVNLLEDGQTSDLTSFEYLLAVATDYDNTDDGNITLNTRMRRGLWVDSTGMPGISTYTLTSGPLTLETEQRGTAFYHSSPGKGNSTSFGDTTDVFRSDAGGRPFTRTVRAVNGSVVSDTNNAPPRMIDLDNYGIDF